MTFSATAMANCPLLSAATRPLADNSWPGREGTSPPGGGGSRPTGSRAHELTKQFLAACAGGDLKALLAMLADDVVVWTDGGGKAKAAPEPVIGAAKAARFLIAVARGTPEGTEVIETNLNGQPGLLALYRRQRGLGRHARHRRGPCQRRDGRGQPRQAQRRERGAGRAPRGQGLDGETGGPQVTKTGNKELSGYFAALSATKYMLLTTFRRDGRAVATPVHVVAEADRVFFRTWDVSGKAKRLRHTPTVEVAPCNSRGRSPGPAVRARAVLLNGEASEQAARVLAKQAPRPSRPLDPLVPPAPRLDYPAIPT